jgi:hypothetical protein
MVEVFCAIALGTWRCPGGDLAALKFGRDPKGRTSRDAPCRDGSRRFLEGLVSEDSACRDVSVRPDLHGDVLGIPVSVRLWKCMRT